MHPSAPRSDVYYPTLGSCFGFTVCCDPHNNHEKQCSNCLHEPEPCSDPNLNLLLLDNLIHSCWTWEAAQRLYAAATPPPGGIAAATAGRGNTSEGSTSHNNFSTFTLLSNPCPPRLAQAGAPLGCLGRRLPLWHRAGRWGPGWVAACHDEL